MLEYRKTGGIAGVDEVLRIEDDGTSRLRRSISGVPQEDMTAHLDPRAVDEVRALAERVDFSEPKSKEAEAYDQLWYEITYRSAEGERHVKVGALSVPEDIQPLLRRLDSIAGELARKNEPT